MDGRDVVGSWKIRVAMGLVPALYTWYTVVTTVWLRYCRHDGYYSKVVPWWMNTTTYIPDSTPLWVFCVGFFILMIAVSFAGLRMGEMGVDILKSLPPLFVAISPGSSNALVKLRAERVALAKQVKETIDTFGPEIYPSFEHEKLVDNDDVDLVAYKSRLRQTETTEVLGSSHCIG